MSNPGDYTRTLTISHTERAPSSAAGNPAFRVFFTDGSDAFTAPDASIGYMINNSDRRGVPLTVTFNASGRIVYADPVPSATS
jgi:hypothetical protein